MQRMLETSNAVVHATGQCNGKFVMDPDSLCLLNS